MTIYPFLNRHFLTWKSFVKKKKESKSNHDIETMTQDIPTGLEGLSLNKIFFLGPGLGNIHKFILKILYRLLANQFLGETIIYEYIRS